MDSDLQSGAPERRLWFKPFLPIDPGYALQALQIFIILGAVAFSVIFYFTARADTEALRSESRIAQMGIQTRMSAAEKDIAERRIQENAFSDQMRSALDKISTTLADLRCPMPVEKRR